MTEHDRPLDYEHRGIDYDYRVPAPTPAERRRVRLYIAAILALAALALWFSHREAQAQEQPRATVYVNACDQSGKCRTVAIPVQACVAGGQAQAAAIFGQSGLTIRAFKCVEGDEA